MVIKGNCYGPVLNALRKEHVPVSIYLVNGIKLQAISNPSINTSFYCVIPLPKWYTTRHLNRRSCTRCQSES